VLTEGDFFQGSDAYLQEARAACTLPVLRKDFVIDAYQVYEARLLGADCILLIVAAIGDAALAELTHLAMDLGMDVLVEVHDIDELERALQVPALLAAQPTRHRCRVVAGLRPPLAMRTPRPLDLGLVTDGGIFTPDDVALMRRNDVQAFLVGEAFMRADEPGVELARVFG